MSADQARLLGAIPCPRVFGLQKIHCKTTYEVLPIVILTMTVHSLHLHSGFIQAFVQPLLILINHTIEEAS